MNNGLLLIRYIIVVLFCVQLTGCVTETQDACQKSPVLLTDLTKPATQRHVSLSNGTSCDSEAARYGA